MKCAVLGDPIAHSLSPVLHRAAYAELGLDWTYAAVRVPAGTLVAFLEGLDGTWRGLSLTMPLKRELVPLADEVSDVARRAGAANTLVLADGRRHCAQHRRAGSGVGDQGAVRRSRSRGDDPGRGSDCHVGRSCPRRPGLRARSPCWRGAQNGPPPPSRPWLRTLPRPSVRYASLAGADVVSDVVVSTIPAAAQRPGLVARCAGVPVVFDVVYHPWPTPLAESATGRVLVSGLDLLVHQAALQVELFTGQEVPVEVLRSAGRAALAG